MSRSIADLAGEHVVVTGGGNGIGAALVTEAAARGASHVSIVDVDDAAADAVATQVVAETDATASTHAIDVASAAAVEEFAESVVGTHGVPALVCANAGVVGPSAPLLETDPAVAEWVLGVNTRGVLHTLQSFGRRQAATGEGGRLMVTASEHSLGVPHLNACMYTASKHAVLGMCDVLRRELPEHVTVSVLMPGLTVSQLWRSVERRPAEHGGPADADPAAGAFMEHAGMPAAVVAERAFDGLAEGRFLIPTHYNARSYADARTAEIGDAFERLATIDTTDYDVGRLVAEMVANLETPLGAED